MCGIVQLLQRAHSYFHRLRTHRRARLRRAATPRRLRHRAARWVRPLLQLASFSAPRPLSLTKVEAHVDPRIRADAPVLLTHALGNATADAAAEAAALRHPPWDPDAQQELDSTIERITFTLRIAALVLALRKSARHFHYQRLPTDRDVTMLPLNVAAPCESSPRHQSPPGALPRLSSMAMLQLLRSYPPRPRP